MECNGPRIHHLYRWWNFKLVVEKNNLNQYCLVDEESGECFNLSRLHDVEALRKYIWKLEFELDKFRNCDEYIGQVIV